MKTKWKAFYIDKEIKSVSELSPLTKFFKRLTFNLKPGDSVWGKAEGIQCALVICCQNRNLLQNPRHGSSHRRVEGIVEGYLTSGVNPRLFRVCIRL